MRLEATSLVGVVEELRAEQAHLDRAYARLDHLRNYGAELATGVATGKGGLAADRVARDAAMNTRLAVRAAASIGDLPLCFGRIDTEEDETFHIGRIGVADAEGDPIVVDWRAPVAEAFYRATAHDRMGILRRRHLRMRARRVVGIDDEVLGEIGDNVGSLVGEGALLAALAQARTGRMGDIVATIQGEQDAAIRAPRHGVLVVQGGPGTGKTAVALHRAAYLLYAHRFPLAQQGVLVVGPNPIFLRYVEGVIPGLGETGVRLATPGELVAGSKVARRDEPVVAARKGALSMAGALAETIASHQQSGNETAHVGYGMHRLALSAEQAAHIVAAGQSAADHNAGRAIVERELLRHLVAEAKRLAERARRSGLVAGDAPPVEAAAILDTLRRSADVRALTEAIWPQLSPEQVAAETLERLGLSLDDERSEHDLALLDEASALLGPPVVRARRRRQAKLVHDDALDRTLADMGLVPRCPACDYAELGLADDGTLVCRSLNCGESFAPSEILGEGADLLLRQVLGRIEDTHGRPASTVRQDETFGHLIVDEAQDLSPMQWRMLLRRCPSRSMTVVGDLGQAKHVWSPPSWAESAVAGSDLSVMELTVNYRTPEEVMEVATAVLDEVAPSLRPPAAVRRSGIPPRSVAVDPSDDVLTVARDIAASESAAVTPGKVALLLPSALATVAAPDVLDADVAELGIDQAKGLEFDSVVVAEPDAFTLPELYVALTRTTGRLVLVHSRPLPRPVALKMS